MDTTTVSLVNQLTLAAAALIACGVLWRAYNNSIAQVAAAKDLHIADLKMLSEKSLNDVRARIMVLEDKTGVDRAARFDYMQPMSKADQDVLLNLDNPTIKRP